MGKVKPSVPKSKGSSAPKSLATIVKAKHQLNKGPATEVIAQPLQIRPKLPALKRKQKAKKVQGKSALTAGKYDDRPPLQKKHVKMMEKKRSMALKIEMIMKEKEDEKRKLKEEKHQRRAIKESKKAGTVGNMTKLKDALPSLDSLIKMKDNNADLKTGIPDYDAIEVNRKEKSVPNKPIKKNNNKVNKRKLKDERMASKTKEIVDRYNYLQQLMNDSTFRNNPRQVIAAHIKNTKLMENESSQ